MHRFIVAVALVVGSRGEAQVGPPVDTSSRLAVTTRLETRALQVGVSLERPAVLLVLEYHPDAGWYPVSRLRRTLTPRRAGSHMLTLPRRLGVLQVPNGTGFITDNQSGCASPNGILNSGGTHCGLSAAPGPGFATTAPGMNVRRSAVIRIEGAVSRASVEAALAEAKRESPEEGLARFAEVLRGTGYSTDWAMVYVPRGG